MFNISLGSYKTQ